MELKTLYEQAPDHNLRDIGRPPIVLVLLWVGLLVGILYFSTIVYQLLPVGIVLLCLYWYVWYTGQLRRAPTLLFVEVDLEKYYLHIACMRHRTLMSQEHRFRFDIRHILAIEPISDSPEPMFRITFDNLPAFECGAPDKEVILRLHGDIQAIQVSITSQSAEKSIQKHL